MSAIRRMMMVMGGGNAPLAVTVIHDYYIYSDSRIRTSSGWFYTTSLAVRSGQVIIFSCYGGAANAVISKELNGTYTMMVKGTSSSSYRTYTWTADEDCFVAFSAKVDTIAPVATVDGVNVTFEGY